MVLKILGISDIHLHRYQNGITLNDVVSVCDEFIECVLSLKPDIVVITGDLTLSRNPEAEVYAVLQDWLKRLNLAAPFVIINLGNHDQTTKSAYSHSTLHFINTFKEILDHTHLVENNHILNNVLMDTDAGKIYIYCIPAGFPLKNNDIWREYADFRICLFHHMVNGTLFQNNTIVSIGEDSQFIDDSRYDLILGGDNHRCQSIPFKNTKGWYIGAPMQHNWGDIGSNRGFLYAELEKLNDIVTHKVIQIQPKHPKFLKETMNISDSGEIILPNTSNTWENNILKITVHGENSLLSNLDVPMLEAKIKDSTKARSIKLYPEFTNIVSISKPVEDVRTDHDYWKDFLQTKINSLSDTDLVEIENLGHRYIND